MEETYHNLKLAQDDFNSVIKTFLKDGQPVQYYTQEEVSTKQRFPKKLLASLIFDLIDGKSNISKWLSNCDNLLAEIKKIKAENSELRDSLDLKEELKKKASITPYYPVPATAIPCTVIENMDDKINLVIGNLLANADETSKKVLSAFDPSKDISANSGVLGGPRFTADNLETCAKYLRIELRDDKECKLFSNKPSIAKRIILEIMSFYPAICKECGEEYSIEFATANPPAVRCFLCFQGSHNCQLNLEKMPKEALPAGSIWYCKSCFDQNIPFKPKKSKSRLDSKSGGSKTTSGASTPKSDNVHHVHVNRSILSDKLNNIKKQDESKELTADENREKTPINEADICKKFKIGKCPHGVSGNTLHSGVKCDKLHPKRCKKFMSNGKNGQHGCNKGKQCPLYHVKHCPSSVRDRTCFSPDCTLVHLARTHRRPQQDNQTPNPSNNSNRSGFRPNQHDRGSVNFQPQSSYRRPNPEQANHRPRFDSQSTRPTSTTNTASNQQRADFLELRDLLTTFKDSFQKELLDLKSQLDLQDKTLITVLSAANQKMSQQVCHPPYPHHFIPPPVPVLPQPNYHHLPQNQLPHLWQQSRVPGC